MEKTEAPTFSWNEMLAMTGNDLNERLGNMTINLPVTVHVTMKDGEVGPPLSAWITQGRGRLANHFYMHLSWPVTVRIVDPDDNPVGSREGRCHVRGPLSKKISTYEEV